MALLAAFAPGGCGEGEGEDGDEVIGVVVGPEGGLVVSDDGVLSIILPAGAVTEPTLVTVELTGDAPPSIGTAYHVTPNLELAEPAVIAYRYALASLGDHEPSELAVGYDNGGIWEPLESLGVDTTTQQVAARDPRLSFAYGLIQGSGGSDTDHGSSDDGASSTGDLDTSSDVTVDSVSGSRLTASAATSVEVGGAPTSSS